MAARAASPAGLRPSARDKGDYMLGVADEERSFIVEDLGRKA
jgi:hypothetical protein